MIKKYIEQTPMECPECRGEGYLQMHTLGTNLYSEPFECSFCNGFGSVIPDIMKVPQCFYGGWGMCPLCGEGQNEGVCQNCLEELWGLMT